MSTTQWPADAPEWADLLTLVYSDGRRKEVVFQIERPKPVKQKIDWGKLRAGLNAKVNRQCKPPMSDWLAWNCDEHTRGNPLPDGLVVEWYGYDATYLPHTDTPTQDRWKIVTRFRIVKIQDGWE